VALLALRKILRMQFLRCERSVRIRLETGLNDTDTCTKRKYYIELAK